MPLVTSLQKAAKNSTANTEEHFYKHQKDKKMRGYQAKPEGRQESGGVGQAQSDTSALVMFADPQEDPERECFDYFWGSEPTKDGDPGKLVTATGQSTKDLSLKKQ